MGEFGDGCCFAYAINTFDEKNGWAFFGELDFIGDAFATFDVADEHLVDELFIDFGWFGDVFFLGFVEEVLNELEGTKPTFHEKIRIAQVREYDYDEVAREIDELVDIAKQFDDMATVRKMKEIVPEYISNNSKYEQLDEKK